MRAVAAGMAAAARTCSNAEGDSHAKNQRHGGDDHQHHQHIVGNQGACSRGAGSR